MNMGKNSKALESLVSFLATTPGRDRSCRLIQYSSRFFKAFILHIAKKENKEFLIQLADKIDALGGSMGMTRKVLRWGRPIGIFRNLFILLKNFKKNESKLDPTQNTWYKYFKALGDLSLALFFLFDHVLYLGRLKIVKDEKLIARADFLSNLFWLFECLSTITSDCIQIHILQNRLKHEMSIGAKTLGELNEMKQKIDGSILNIIRNLIDLPIAVHFINSKFLDPGFVGVLGTITSLIGCYQSWPAQK